MKYLFFVKQPGESDHEAVEVNASGAREAAQRAAGEIFDSLDCQDDIDELPLLVTDEAGRQWLVDVQVERQVEYDFYPGSVTEVVK